MPEECVPADYTEMDLLEAKRFDKKVKENFMPAIVSAKAYSSPDKLQEVVNKAGISNFHISYDRAGLWVEIKK